MSDGRDAIEDIIDFWFAHPERWWRQSDAFDAEVRERFGALAARATAGELDAWADTPRGRLALILLLDQMNRNIHRDSPRAYDGDSRAQELCVDGVGDGDDAELAPLERAFFYMPLMHAERLDLQELSCAYFRKLAEAAPETCGGYVKHAQQHRDVVARFGRFPHRNELFDRETTDEEREMLAKGRFG